MITRTFGVQTAKGSLLRNYLRFFNSGSAWTVYAARNQNPPGRISDLSIASPATETHYNSPQQEEGVQPRGDGQSPFNPVIAMFLGLAFLLTAATQPSTHTLITPGKVAVEWYFSDTTGTWDKDVKAETRVWMEVRSANGKDWAKEGYNPSYTYVTVKDCVPVVRKLGENRYEIAFRSEIAKDLP